MLLLVILENSSDHKLVFFFFFGNKNLIKKINKIHKKKGRANTWKTDMRIARTPYTLKPIGLLGSFLSELAVESLNR